MNSSLPLLLISSEFVILDKLTWNKGNKCSWTYQSSQALSSQTQIKWDSLESYKQPNPHPKKTKTPPLPTTTFDNNSSNKQKKKTLMTYKPPPKKSLSTNPPQKKKTLYIYKPTNQPTNQKQKTIQPSKFQWWPYPHRWSLARAPSRNLCRLLFGSPEKRPPNERRKSERLS